MAPLALATRTLLLASKPTIAARVRQIQLSRTTLPLATPWSGFLTKLSALTVLELIDTSAEGALNLVALASPPLREVSIVGDSVDFYSRIDPQTIRRLKPCLRSLALVSTYPGTSPDSYPTPKLIAAIVGYLSESLQSLKLRIADWSKLKQLDELKHLHIVIDTYPEELLDLTDLPGTVARHLRSFPPGVGVDTLISFSGRTISLLNHTVQYGSEKQVWTLIVHHRADPSLEIFDPHVSDNRYLPASLAVVSEKFSTARLLMELGGVLFSPLVDPAAEFLDRFPSLKPGSPLTELQNWMFREYWPTMLSTKAPSDVIGITIDRLFLLLHKQVAGFSLKDLVKFILSRQQIFGPFSLHQTDSNGCPLSHHCRFICDLVYMETEKIDWRLLDSARLDAVECLALRNSPLTLPMLLRWCSTDEDFIRHCTPNVFMALCGLGCAWVMNRMADLLPSDRWLDPITAWVQIQLRLSPNITLATISEITSAPMVKMALAAVFRPFAEVSAAPWFRRSTLTVKAPLPYESSGPLGAFLIQQIPRHFAGPSDAEAWIGEKDRRGRTAQNLIRILARTKADLHTRLSKLSQLYLPHSAWSCP